MELTGKKFVVTGANGGLGRGVVETALARGASVVLVDIAVDENNAAGASGVERHALDLCDAAATARFFSDLGDFDGVFNLAGGFAMGPTVYEYTEEDWDAMFKINVQTLQNVLKAAVPTLVARGRGSIVNVGALGALRGQGQMSAYGASKSVVMRMTESLSDEVRDKGVNVNAVLPSVIDTPRNREDMPDADYSKWVKPADLGSVICFLASDAARAIHGALVPVRGLSD